MFIFNEYSNYKASRKKRSAVFRVFDFKIDSVNGILNIADRFEQSIVITSWEKKVIFLLPAHPPNSYVRPATPLNVASLLPNIHNLKPCLTTPSNNTRYLL